MRGMLIRWAMAGLAALHLCWGAWAYLAPRHFFDTFPGLGHTWTAAYPPFNAHLVTDLGAIFLTLGVLLALAAWRGNRDVTIVVLTGVLVFSTLHLLYHILDHGSLTGFDLGGSLATLIGGVALPAVLLAATLSRAPDSRRRADQRSTNEGRAPS